MASALDTASDPLIDRGTLPAGGLRFVRPYAPGIVGVLGLVTVLLIADVAFLDVFLYLVYFVLAIIVPGTLLYRSIVGFGSSLLEDLAWGSVVGLIAELAAWGALTRLGINEALWAWPAALVLAFTVTPRLRRHWRRGSGRPTTPPVLAWATTVASLLGTGLMATRYFLANGVPPSGVGSFVDAPWHTGVAYEAIRSVPLRTPQATAEGVLNYHWFADAHFGAAHLTSGVDLPTIVLRVGLVPLIVVMVATTIVLGHRITQRSVAAALAGLVVVATTVGADLWPRLYMLRVLYPESPTGVYAVGISCLLVSFLVDVLREGRLSRGACWLLTPLLLAAIGSKPSTLIVLIPATGLTWLYRLVRERYLDRWLTLMLVALGIAVVVSFPLFASPGGSKLDPSLSQVLAWRGTTGVQSPTWGLVLTAIVKGYLLALLGTAAFLLRPLRKNPVAALLAAITVTGFVEAWVISHPGLSQMFFWTSAAPFAAILAAWGVVTLIDAVAIRPVRAAQFAGIVSMVVLVSIAMVRVHSTTRSSLLVGWALLLLSGGVALMTGRAVGFSRRASALSAGVALVALGTPAALLAAPWTAKSSPFSERVLKQNQAAVWIEGNVPLYDLLATNSHCLTATRPHCDARSFWLSGYGGRRVLVEGFGVSPEALRRDLVDGYKAWRQPYHNQPLLALNDVAFTAPTVKGLRLLAEDYDVEWLVADTYAGPVSPDLAELTELVYSNGQVSVYRLDPSRLPSDGDLGG